MQLYKTLLKEFLQFKSVSTNPEFQEGVQATANWLHQLFEENNFSSKLIDGYGNPIVLARYETNKSFPTVLIYGHYDIQPADISDGWESDPFDLKERDGRIFARGAVDNKGQILIHIASVIELIKQNKLRYNVIFCIEGNEETGSPDLPQFVKAHREDLMCDVVLISDGELTAEHPVLESSFRGAMNFQIEIITSDKDLHSGLFGGTVPSASHELIFLLSKLFENEAYTIAIPKFYKNIPTPTQKDIEQNTSIPFTDGEFFSLTGTKRILTENNYDFFSQLGFRPTIQVTGIQAGYTGIGYRNSVPHQAIAKCNVRLVENQNPEDIKKLLVEFVQNNTPKYVHASITFDEASPAVSLDISNQFAEKACKILEEVYEKPVVIKRCGATIPIVHDFKKILQVPQLLVPLANEDCRMHATNENFRVDLIEKGLEFSSRFLSN